MDIDENKERYFHEYESLQIHDLMLKDRPRQEAYRNAILKNKSIFENKIVLDVGSGTGILSAFCAIAGSRLVYAVEASDVAKIAVSVMEENNLSHIVKVVQSKIENFELPSDAEKVDIIVSEWMGFYLLHEGMLDSVIYARDRFLKSDGKMFPESAQIFISPCSLPQLFDYYNDVDGVRLQSFARFLRLEKSTTPEIMSIEADNLLHEGTVVTWLDLNEVSLADLNEICSEEVVCIQKSGSYQGFCIWFECIFPTENLEVQPIVLSTSPRNPQTHWKQCVIPLPEDNVEAVSIGEPIAFQLSIKRNAENQRRYNIELNLKDQNLVQHPLPCDCIMTKCILTKAHLNSLENNVGMG